MPITYRRKTVFFQSMVTVEDAEDLLQWIQKNPQGEVNLYDCTHLHTANLQVLMATRIAVVAWPKDAAFKNWLTAALS
jgi:hypothetical protein